MTTPLYVSVPAIAKALGLAPQTVRGWLQQGTLQGIHSQVERHYLDERPRKTTRGRWMVELASVERLLERLYDGKPIPQGVKRALGDLTG